jgi:hypothetical protein
MLGEIYLCATIILLFFLYSKIKKKTRMEKIKLKTLMIKDNAKSLLSLYNLFIYIYWNYKNMKMFDNNIKMRLNILNENKSQVNELSLLFKYITKMLNLYECYRKYDTLQLFKITSHEDKFNIEVNFMGTNSNNNNERQESKIEISKTQKNIFSLLYAMCIYINNINHMKEKEYNELNNNKLYRQLFDEINDISYDLILHFSKNIESDTNQLDSNTKIVYYIDNIKYTIILKYLKFEKNKFRTIEYPNYFENEKENYKEPEYNDNIENAFDILNKNNI